MSISDGETSRPKEEKLQAKWKPSAQRSTGQKRNWTIKWQIKSKPVSWIEKKNNDVINQPHFIYFSISNSIMIDEEEHFFNWKIKQMFETFFWLLFQISCLIFGQKWDNVFR